jgi:hypothetical protein
VSPVSITDAFVVIMVFLVILSWIVGTGQDDYNRACEGHDGVTQVLSHPFGAISGGASAVCRDGVVVKVQE